MVVREQNTDPRHARYASRAIPIRPCQPASPRRSGDDRLWV